MKESLLIKQPQTWNVLDLSLNQLVRKYMNITPLSSQRLFHFHCSIGALFYSNQTNTILSQRQVTLSSKSNLCAFEMEYPKTLKTDYKF